MRTFGSLLSLLCFSLLFVACEEMPVGPSVGSGTELIATVDGVALNFDIEAGQTTYNETQLFGTIAGATLALPVVAINLTFSGVDLDNDTFPRTLTGTEVSITVATENEQGDPVAFDSRNPGGSGIITISATDGTIVDGTFSGILFEDGDSIVVGNGQFSARLSGS